jgi:diguanylate cyclase (GGDEF)-like protein
MTPPVVVAALALLPLAAAFASLPKNAWVAAAFGAAGLGASVYMAATVGPSDWLAYGFVVAAACGYVAYKVRRAALKEASWRMQFDARKRQAAEMAERLAKLKIEGSQGEAEQKKALAIYGVVKGLSEALDYETMRPKLESAVQQQLGVEEFALYVSDMRSEGTMHPLAKRRLVGSVGAAWDTLKSHLESHKLPLDQPHFLPAPQNAIAIPIRHGQELVGYLFGRVPPRSEGPKLVELARRFGEDIAFALKRVRLFQEVERLSELDGLTGVQRRVMWDQRIKDETQRARTFKTGYCVLLLDIDHFKRLNDTYGHPFGDQVLRRIGEVLRRTIYDTDFVARYGGEEFGVLLPRADPQGVMVKAERIRQAIEKEAFSHGLESLKVTVSIGLAAFPRDGQTPDEVVAAADRALYVAKDQGRNRVIDVGAERGAA